MGDVCDISVGQDDVLVSSGIFHVDVLAALDQGQLVRVGLTREKEERVLAVSLVNDGGLG